MQLLEVPQRRSKRKGRPSNILRHLEPPNRDVSPAPANCIRALGILFLVGGLKMKPALVAHQPTSLPALHSLSRPTSLRVVLVLHKTLVRILSSRLSPSTEVVAVSLSLLRRQDHPNTSITDSPKNTRPLPALHLASPILRFTLLPRILAPQLV